MLQRKENGEDDPETNIYGFLIGVEIADGQTTADQVALKLADALTFVEGVGRVTVDVLGAMEVLDNEWSESGLESDVEGEC